MDMQEELSLQRISKLKIVLLLTSSFIAVEVISGFVTGSLALIADAGHMLTDVGGIALALSLQLTSLGNEQPHREPMASTEGRYLRH
jgi:Co/Zn/Cd efflux system component